MIHSTGIATLVLALSSAPSVLGQQTIGAEIGRVGGSFFASNPDLEASGLAASPDGTHLVGVSDDGKLFFLNLAVDENLDLLDEGHCWVDLAGLVPNNNNFEGCAFDQTSLYVIHEGSATDPPYLHKLSYAYDPGVGSCSATVDASFDLTGALPCLPGTNGLESLALKSPGDDGTSTPAVFLVGFQDTGVVYEITSRGESNGGTCYDGPGVDGISGSFYDASTGYLWSVYDNQDKLAAVDLANDCSLGTYDTFSAQEEGLAIDAQRNRMYIASDGGGQGTPSHVAIHNWAFYLSPEDCCGDGVCGGSEDCVSCPRDCDGKVNGNPNNRFCCEGPGNTCEGWAGCGENTCQGEGLPKVECSFDLCGTDPNGGGCSLNDDGSECDGSDESTCLACPDICTWSRRRGGSCSSSA